MSVQERKQSAAMQKNPDLERLETTLVQLGFALEQQEIQAETLRTRQGEARKTVVQQIGRLEARIKDLLAENSQGTAAAPTSPVAQGEK